MFEETEYSAGYSIDKILFLQILQKAREEALNSYNISSSWSKAGLFLFNPELVINALPSVQLRLAQASLSKPLSCPSPRGSPVPTTQATITLCNVQDVNQILAKSRAVEAHVEAFEARIEEQITSLKLMVEKLAKTTTTALTQYQLEQRMNLKLLAAQDRQKQRKQRSGIQGTDARVYNKEGIQKALDAKAAAAKEVSDAKRLEGAP
jgi:hypothetical protein